MSNCPKCGAEWNGIRGSAYGYTPYPCGSRFDRHGCLHQSKDCRIAQLEAEVAALREKYESEVRLHNGLVDHEMEEHKKQITMLREGLE